jgi:hypothetical protein
MTRHNVDAGVVYGANTRFNIFFSYFLGGKRLSHAIRFLPSMSWSKADTIQAGDTVMFWLVRSLLDIDSGLKLAETGCS